jgi:DNA repair protein RadC
MVAAAAMEPAPRITDMLAADRPRERLAEQGADALRNAELIAILLRTGVRGANAVAVAEQLLRQFHTLEGIARASLADLRRVKGIGLDKAVTLHAAFKLAGRLAAEVRSESPCLAEPAAIAAMIREDAVSWSVERLLVLSLNARHRWIRTDLVAEGILDRVLVHAREVFRPAIAAGAQAIALVHNHPSGDPEPSPADVIITRDLARAGHLLKMDLIDHVIVGRPAAHRPYDFVSLRALGHITKPL